MITALMQTHGTKELRIGDLSRASGGGPVHACVPINAHRWLEQVHRRELVHHH